MVASLTSCTNNEDNSHKGLRPKTREDFIEYYKYTSSGSFCEEYYIKDIIKNLNINSNSYTGQMLIAQNLIECFEYSKSTIHTPPKFFP